MDFAVGSELKHTQAILHPTKNSAARGHQNDATTGSNTPQTGAEFTIQQLISLLQFTVQLSFHLLILVHRALLPRCPLLAFFCTYATAGTCFIISDQGIC